MSEEQEFLVLVAHELRNPLGNIVAATTLLERLPTSDQDRLDRCVQAIRHAADRMTRLLEDLVAESSIARGELRIDRQPFDAREIVEDSTLAHAPLAAEKALWLATDTADQPLRVLVDRMRIDQVLANLLGNAIKFTPPGGRITVSAKRDGAGVRIAVADTGAGIPEDELPRVFDRYWRSPGSGGLGLGLAIVRQLIEAHGGAVAVRSVHGVGTTVELTLPLAE